MNNSSKFFANRSCEYYPCHKGLDDLNCLFCYCPFYLWEHCPGNPHWKPRDNGRRLKDCTACIYPHVADHYDDIMKRLAKAAEEGVPNE